MQPRRGHASLGFFVAAVMLAPWPAAASAEEAAARAKCRSPFDVAFSPDGQRLAVSDRTGGVLAILDVGAGKVTAEVPLRGEPTGLLWARDGHRVFVAEYGAGSVAEIDPGAAGVVRRLEVGRRPVGLAIAAEAKRLLAANSESDSVTAVDLAEGKAMARIQVVRRPLFIAVTPDERIAIVANALPDRPATDPMSSACLSFIDLETLENVANVRLSAGSMNVRQVAVSPDGRWAYALHTVGRTQVPTTQLDRGWVNTNGMSIVDIASRQSAATVLLDHVMEGAANPWGLVLSKDGTRLWVTLAGSHQASRVELAALHRFIEGQIPDDHRLARTASYAPGTESIWLRIKRDPKEKAELVNDLAALYAADLAHRFPLEGNGPRGIDLSPDGRLLAVAMYYSGAVAFVDPSTCRIKARVSLGAGPEPDLVRLGEIAFHDATRCFQHWMSCSTCHEDGRMDGMNWDLLNDGIGNPKNTRSLLWSHKTPPAMSLGVRAGMPEAVEAGFIHIQFHQPEVETLRAVEAYLASLEPEPSPRLAADGGLSDAAKRGREIYNRKETNCASCHPAPLYTDLKRYDVGTKGMFDQKTEFDTPTLVELYRTRPYLHDGSAATLKELLTERNKEDKHGKTSHLGPQEIDDLIEYLLSL